MQSLLVLVILLFARAPLAPSESESGSCCSCPVPGGGVDGGPLYGTRPVRVNPQDSFSKGSANPRRLDPEPQTVLPPATPPTTTTPITPTLPTRSFRGSVLCVLGRYQPTERPTQIKERKQPAPSRNEHHEHQPGFGRIESEHHKH